MQIDDRCGRGEEANGVTGRDITEAGNGRGKGDAGNIWRWGGKAPRPARPKPETGSGGVAVG